MKKIVILFACVFLVTMNFACETPDPGPGPGGTCNNPIPDPTPVNTSNQGAPPTGSYDVVIEQDAELMTHTIYRPVVNNTKMPIIVWGNGGCSKDSLGFKEFLMELASHGFLIVADGTPRSGGAGCGGAGGGGMSGQDGAALLEALDWAFEANDNPCSPYYQKLDTSKTAAMGQSCGGLMTLNISSDPRLTTIVVWNSGLFQRNQQLYRNLHTPVAYFSGGESDIAYSNAQADFNAINNVPIFWGDLPVGHMGTYNQDNGGEFGRVGVAWLKWQLMGETGPDGEGMFVGRNCGLCNADRWTVKKKNME